jgi:anti-sigma factor RsiW
MEDNAQHINEDLLEQYLFGTLPDAEIEKLEEHLLVCHSCIDAAEQLVAFVESLRSTLENAAPRTRVAGRQSVDIA